MTLHNLAADFTKNYMQTRLQASTMRGYTVNLNNHILPRLGDITPQELTADDLDELTAELRGTLSNKSIIYVHATLRKMLAYALKRGYIEKSPYGTYDLPRVNAYRYNIWREEELLTALHQIKGTNIEIPVTMALCYGLRRGECLGLIPSLDLDAKNNVLHVQRSRSVERGGLIVTPCKTKHSNRHILLKPEHSRLLLRSCLPGQYAYDASPKTLDNNFKKFMELNNLPLIRFHDLRHSYATYMLYKGVNPKIVSGVLGHSSVKVTLDLYSHPDVSMQSVCLDAFGTLGNSGTERRYEKHQKQNVL